jgi:hypothetical protein
MLALHGACELAENWARGFGDSSNAKEVLSCDGWNSVGMLDELDDMLEALVASGNVSGTDDAVVTEMEPYGAPNAEQLVPTENQAAAAVATAVVWRRYCQPVLARLIGQIEQAAAGSAGGELAGQLGRQLDAKTSEAAVLTLDAFGRLLGKLGPKSAPLSCANISEAVQAALGLSFDADECWPPLVVGAEENVADAAASEVAELAQPEVAEVSDALRLVLLVVSAMLRHRIVNIKPSALFPADQNFCPDGGLELFPPLARLGPAHVASSSAYAGYTGYTPAAGEVQSSALRTSGRESVAIRKEQEWLLERVVGQNDLDTALALALALGHSADRVRRGYVQRNLEMGNDLEASRVLSTIQDQQSLGVSMLLACRQRLCRILQDAADLEKQQQDAVAAAREKRGPPVRRRPPSAQQLQELRFLSAMTSRLKLKTVSPLHLSHRLLL